MVGGMKRCRNMDGVFIEVAYLVFSLLPSRMSALCEYVSSCFRQARRNSRPTHPVTRVDSFYSPSPHLLPLSSFTVHRSPNSSPTSATTLLPPNLLTVPSSNPNVRSISPFPTPFSSLITSICLIVTTSKNRLPGNPFLPTFANSASAASVRAARAVRTRTAGFVEGEGKICC